MKRQTLGEFTQKLGRMIKGLNPFLLTETQLSDTQNMQPYHGGYKQRKGVTELTTSAVATSLEFKSIFQFRKLDGTTDVMLAHTYDATNGERIMKASALPSSTCTWSELYTMESGCDPAQFAQVGNALMIANGEEYLIWRGTESWATAVFFYDQSADHYFNFYDEMLDSSTLKRMGLDASTTSDFLYVASDMPLDEIQVTVGVANEETASLTVEKYCGPGGWHSISSVSDGTSDGGATLGQNGTISWTQYVGDETMSDSFTSPAADFSDMWTVSNPNSVMSVTGGQVVLTPGNGDDDDTGYFLTNESMWLSGDFDVYLQFSDLSWSQPSAGDNHFKFKLIQDANNQAQFKYEYTTGGTRQYACDVYDGGAWQGEVTSATTDNSGYMRIKRVGDDISFYKGSPSSWTQIGSTFTGMWDGDVYLSVSFDLQDVSEWTSLDFDQFYVVNGHERYAEQQYIMDGVPGYYYRLSWGAALSDPTSLTKIRVHAPMDKVRDVWSGEFLGVTGCYVYDGTSYIDYIAEVSNTSSALYCDYSDATTSYSLFVGFSHPVSQIHFFIPAEQGNGNNVSISTVQYWSSNGEWKSVGSVTDTTETGDAALTQSGYVSFSAPSDIKSRKVGGDGVPWYWYKLTYDATMDAETYIYHIKGVPEPTEMYKCVGAAAYKQRAWQIAPEFVENALRYSAYRKQSTWNGQDSGYIYFGERPLKCAVPFYNELLVFADTELWMLQGASPTNFGRLRLSAQIGTPAPHSVVTVESGVQIGENYKIVVLWMFYDGIYMFDGIKWLKISSPDIENFFDPDHDDYINPSYIDRTYGEYDWETQCVNWIIYSGPTQSTPNKMISLHFPTMWYGIYSFETAISSMARIINNRHYTVAGGYSSGKFYRLFNGNTDVDSSGTATAVDAWVVTRDLHFSYSKGQKQREFSLITDETDGGMLELDEYPDGSETPREVGKGKLASLGKKFRVHQWGLKDYPGAISSKFRIRNRSKDKRMSVLGYSTTVDEQRLKD